jgi:hypothetical protein
MTGEHLKQQARRVVIGLDADGRSCIESDELAPDRLAGPANTKCDLWRMAGVPGSFGDGDGLEDGVITLPPIGGLVYRIASFPPDSEFDRSQGYSDAHGPLAGSIAPEDSGGIAGLHVTETIDVVTMLSGELWAVMETGETLLRPGDTLVQRGTKHAWSNRTDKPAVIVSIMIDAASRPTEQ